jgi:hypothetical protein
MSGQNTKGGLASQEMADGEDNTMEEEGEEGEVPDKNMENQGTQRKTRTKKKAQINDDNCLTSSKKCMSKQYSVFCLLCAIR